MRTASRTFPRSRDRNWLIPVTSRGYCRLSGGKAKYRLGLRAYPHKVTDFVNFSTRNCLQNKDKLTIRMKIGGRPWPPTKGYLSLLPHAWSADFAEPLSFPPRSMNPFLAKLGSTSGATLLVGVPRLGCYPGCCGGRVSNEPFSDLLEKPLNTPFCQGNSFSMGEGAGAYHRRQE
jgi:hypothetical protein